MAHAAGSELFFLGTIQINEYKKSMSWKHVAPAVANNKLKLDLKSLVCTKDLIQTLNKNKTSSFTNCHMQLKHCFFTVNLKKKETHL